MKPSHFNCRFGMLIAALLLLGAGSTSSLHAEAEVPLHVQTTAYGTVQGNVTLSGTFLPTLPNGNDAYRTDSATADSNNWSLYVAINNTKVELGKSYTVSLYGDYFEYAQVNIVVPQGFRAVIDNQVRTSAVVLGDFVFRIEPLRQHPGLAGYASEVSSVGVLWSLPLGKLSNGGSAGELVFSGTGLQSDWKDLLLEGISYESTSDEVQVFRDSQSGKITDVLSPQLGVKIDRNTYNGTTDITCYSSVNPYYVPNGTPQITGPIVATYRMEKGATATSLKITKTTTITEVMTLSRSGTWPNYQWVKTPWTKLNTTPLKEITTQSTGVSGGRTESVAVRVPGGSSIYNLSRTYADSSAGEILTAETVGTSNALTGSFTYYTTPSAATWGKLDSATLGTGGWVANDYYDNYPSFPGNGMVKRTYKPYLDSPAAVTKNPSLGEVMDYEYVLDQWGGPARVSLVERRINGVLVSRTSSTYVYSVNPTVVTETQVTSYASGQSLTSVHTSYGPYTSFLGRMPRSTTGPDGVRKSYVYRQGTYSGGAFTGSSSGTDTYSAIITGCASASSETNSTPYNEPAGGGLLGNFEPLYLVPNKSTMEVSIRDRRALVLRTELHCYTGSGWQQVSHEDFTYNDSALLTSSVKSNGATQSSIYSGQQKTSDTDETGVTKTYEYDNAGRAIRVTRTGFGGINALSTAFTYDAMDHVLSTTTAGWGTTETLVKSAAFDDAGRVTSETEPGLGAVTHAYNVPSRTHTITRPDGSTVIDQTYRDGRLASRTGTGVVAEYYAFGVETDGRTWSRKDVGLSTSTRWTKAWSDWAGRATRSERPAFTGLPNLVEENFYDATTGRLYKTTKSGYAPTRFEYHALGEVKRSGLDVDDNGLVPASNDRIEESETMFESFEGAWWSKAEKRRYLTAGSGTVTTVEIARKRVTGFPANRQSETQSTDPNGNVTIATIDVDRAGRTVVRTTSRVGIAGKQVETLVNGLPVRALDFNGLLTSTQYDGLMRVSAVIDSRGNATRTAYYTGSALKQSVTDAANHAIATYGYDTSGRVIWQADALGHLTRTSYTLRAQPHRTWGGGTYPVEFGYDATFGDRTSQSTFRGGTGWDGATWPGSPGTADTTTWTYDAPSGLNTTKTDPLGRDERYTWNLRGQLNTREWSRLVTIGPAAGQRVKTTYTYSATTGEQTAIAYNDGLTTDLTYAYSRTGLPDTITDRTGTRTFTYHLPSSTVVAEALPTGYFGGRKILYKRESVLAGLIGRPIGYKLGTVALPSQDQEVTYGYENLDRLTSVSVGTANASAWNTFRYAYREDSDLIETLTVDNSPFVVTRTYEEDRDLLTSIESKSGSTIYTKFSYTYDARRFRSTVLQEGTAYADYGDATNRQFAYNGRGELTAGIGYLGTNVTSQAAPLPGRRHEYAYDSIGNRQWSNSTGVSGLRDDYTANALNQYVARENNTLSLSGTATSDAVVAVKGRTVTAGRQGRFWSDEVTVSNVLGPWAGPLSVYATKPSGGSNVMRIDSRAAQLPAVAQSFSYDLDGNTLSDGIWDYKWDAENRLVRLETSIAARSAGYAHRILNFTYDYLGRRVQKQVMDGVTSTEISSQRFIYNGWDVIAEYSVAAGTTLDKLQRTYAWGIDLASSLTKAGGVGALLQFANTPTGETYLPTYDGNGNVASLVNLGTGALAASYEYTPFGEMLRDEVLDNAVSTYAFKFSTKWRDVETGWSYYGRRYYEARNGRFIGRDPIGEQGGINLYGFCGNNPVDRWDILGMVAPEEARKILDMEINRDAKLFLGKGETLTHSHPGQSLSEVSDAADFDLVMTRGELEMIARGEQSYGAAGPSGESLAVGGSPIEMAPFVVESTSGGTIGQPGFWGSFVPIYGSGRAAIEDFENGRWGWGSINTAMAITDVFLLKALVTGALRGLTGAARREAMAEIRRVGAAGESVVRALEDIGEKTAIRIPGSNQLRVVDGLTGTTLNEVKSVGSLSYTQQLRDYAAYAGQNGLTFQLWVREGAELSGPLVEAIERGEIVLRTFSPGG